MIKFQRTYVFNTENALRGMRNPLNSWDKADSYYDESGNYIIGEKDLNLAQRLIKGGSEHRKFMRQIFVTVDITAPLYWWKEFDTYKVGTVANSCSTMHKIHSKEITKDDFSCDRMSEDALAALDNLIMFIEERRKVFVETKDKKSWDDIIQLLPSSYMQMRTVTLNYENILAMINQRSFHKLPEWSAGFITWAKNLPYSNELLYFTKE